MPLPPALLQRLAKRGIVDRAKESAPKHPPVNEEIIAEDYDDVEEQEPYPYDYEPVKKPVENFWSERLKRRIVDGSINGAGYKACPNKHNIYHNCTLYCMNTYGDGILEPNRNYLKRKQRLLRRYPLPKDWSEVYDVGCGIHYYWQGTDDLVSWLPPGHPKSVISKSAAVLRKELEALHPEIEDTTEEVNMTIHIEGMNIELPIPTEKHQEPDPPKPPPQKKPKARDLEKTIRSRSERRMRADVHKEGALDPMDPAAYSSVPRGKWSAGLETESIEQSGVDSTASGPLFQMRPYPSPGAILQANAAAAAKARGAKDLNNDENDENNDSDEM